MAIGRTNVCGTGTVISDEAPLFVYTGQYERIDDGNNNWRIKFKTSGTLRFTMLNSAKRGIEMFLVGGGGGGGACDYAGGGGGGYTLTASIVPRVNYDYAVVVGNGGAGNNDGESTNAFGFTAEGGKTGGVSYGGAGGSQGGTFQQAGYSDGLGENGQGYSTREFGTGELYAGGGGGNGSTAAYGGAGGGGSGADANGSHSGVANTGGGGGGASSQGGTFAGYSGGSGIVIIRNTRR